MNEEPIPPTPSIPFLHSSPVDQQMQWLFVRCIAMRESWFEEIGHDTRGGVSSDMYKILIQELFKVLLSTL